MSTGQSNLEALRRDDAEHRAMPTAYEAWLEENAEALTPATPSIFEEGAHPFDVAVLAIAIARRNRTAAAAALAQCLIDASEENGDELPLYELLSLSFVLLWRRYPEAERLFETVQSRLEAQGGVNSVFNGDDVLRVEADTLLRKLTLLFSNKSTFPYGLHGAVVSFAIHRGSINETLVPAIAGCDLAGRQQYIDLQRAHPEFFPDLGDVMAWDSPYHDIDEEHPGFEFLWAALAIVGPVIFWFLVD